MSGDVSLRVWRRDEARAWLELHRAAVHAFAPSVYAPEIVDAWAPLPITEEHVAGCAANVAQERRFVAERDGVLVGIGGLRVDLAAISACFVIPDAARSGVGSALLRRLEAAARAEGLTRLTVNSSLNAVAFYEANGFVFERRAVHRLAGGVEMPDVELSKSL